MAAAMSLGALRWYRFEDHLPEFEEVIVFNPDVLAQLVPESERSKYEGGEIHVRYWSRAELMERGHLRQNL